jgi:hypothetical protein
MSNSESRKQAEQRTGRGRPPFPGPLPMQGGSGSVGVRVIFGFLSNHKSGVEGSDVLIPDWKEF